MIKINTTTNVSANIYVGEVENQKNVAYANASVSKNGDVSINKSIQDGEMKKIHQIQESNEVNNHGKEYGKSYVLRFRYPRLLHQSSCYES